MAGDTKHKARRRRRRRRRNVRPIIYLC